MYLSLNLLDSLWIAGLAAALGSHAVYVQRDPSPATVVIVYVALWTSWPALQMLRYDASASSALFETTIFITIYTIALLSSIGIYRIFFHRLRRFPGPLSLRLSKFAFIPIDIKGHRPRSLAALHRKYGDVVRVGPRELSINDPNATQAILGGKSQLVKGPWYSLSHARKGPRGLNLFSLIDPKQRRTRRRIWDRAFNVKALSSYEPCLRTFTEAIMQKIDSKAGTQSSLNVDEWCVFFAFDIMGQIGFSKSFDMTGQGRFTNEIVILEKFLAGSMIFANIPYIGSVLSKVPNPMKTFELYTKAAVEERMRRSEKQNAASDGIPDIFAHLLGEVEETGYDYTKLELASEAGLVVIAGSDTSSSTLTLALFSLASQQNDLERLRTEIQSAFHDQETIEDFDILAKQCPFLNAVIEETLRMYPPVPSGVQREVPADGQGVHVPLRDGKTVYLPPGTVVSLPTTAIHHDTRNYGADAARFRPARWLEAGQGMDKSAFLAFGYGPTSCVGKQLAYMEMRIFLANFVNRFDFTLAKDFDVQEFKDGIMDTFTMTRRTPLRLQVTKCK